MIGVAAVWCMLGCQDGGTGDTGFVDRDGDGVAARLDCDDSDPSRSPLLLEVCNGQDDDCDGLVDQDDPDVGAMTWYLDGDGDGFGDDETGLVLCDDPGDRTTTGGDCDDTSPEVNPDAQEICSLQDDDCDGLVDDADDSVDSTGFATWWTDADDDGYGVPGDTHEGCDPGANWADNDTDCDDEEPLAWGGAAEVCGDGVDNDCDSATTGDCGAYGLVRLVEAEVAWVGLTAGEHVGAALQVLGDTDGDGRSDFAVGVPNAMGTGGELFGRVFVLRGEPWGSTDIENAAGTSRIGIEHRGEVGRSLAAPGDVDGDGLADLAIGAPGVDGGAEDSGAVYLDVLVGTTPGAVDSARTTYLGDTLAGRLGHAVVAAGDPTGDGVAELLIGAYNAGGDRAPGMALLVSGALTGTVDTVVEAELSLTGEGDYSYAGVALATGDTDGDGVPELAVGAPLDDQGGDDGGIAWVVAGGQTGALQLADADARVLGVRSGDLLGSALAFADLDGDGLEDLVVGAPGDSSAEEGAGAVGIFPLPAGDLVLTDAHAQRQGVEAFELAGAALDAGGDYNGDGAPDLFVGSPYRPIDLGTTGGGYVLLGPLGASASLTTADLRLWGEAEGDLAGAAVALIGDLDGDGWGEALLGAPGAARVYGVGGGSGL